VDSFAEDALLQALQSPDKAPIVRDILISSGLIDYGIFAFNSAKLEPQRVYIILPYAQDTCRWFSLIQPDSALQVSAPSRIVILSLHRELSPDECETFLTYIGTSETGVTETLPAIDNTSLITERSEISLPIPLRSTKEKLSLSVKHYYIPTKANLQLHTLAIPKAGIPRQYLAFGIGPALVYEPDLQFAFAGDTVTLQQDGKHFSTTGRITMSFLPGRVVLPEHQYRASFWQRFNIESGVGFLLSQVFAGVGFQLWENIELTYGQTWYSLPDTTYSLVTPLRSFAELEDAFPKIATRNWYIGLRIDAIKF
jgi:hypothetical protein